MTSDNFSSNPKHLIKKIPCDDKLMIWGSVRGVVSPRKRLLKISHLMRSCFYDWIGYDDVAFSMKLQEWQFEVRKSS